MVYLKTAPWFLRSLYPARVWQMPVAEKKLYLTFDDGPTPSVTHFVLDELKKYDALATFFCIGKNVVENPITYKRILNEGHAVGNHTYNHLNGYKTADSVYLDNIFEAQQVISSKIFRPPYGRMTKFQEQQLRGNKYALKTIMWSVLSADYDMDISKEKCLLNVTDNAGPGSIIVFHDSIKACANMIYALPRVLQHFKNKGYQFCKIEV